MAEYSYGYDNGGRDRTDAGGGSRAVICPNCGEPNSPEAKYCGICGEKLPSTRCYCPDCGRVYPSEMAYCIECGSMTVPGDPPRRRASYKDTVPAAGKSWLVTLLLCVFVGALGVHRFYVGKIGTGILWLLTGGCLGIGWIVDIIVIACGNFRDSHGAPIRE